MNTINPRLREFVRTDRHGNDIQGTNSYRKRKPRIGTWREITTVPCCTAFLLFYTPSDVTDTDFLLTIECDSNPLLTLNFSTESATTDINGVVAGLRKHAKTVGKWSTDGTQIELQLDSNLALNCDGGSLSFSVEPS